MIDKWVWCLRGNRLGLNGQSGCGLKTLEIWKGVAKIWDTGMGLELHDVID